MPRVVISDTSPVHYLVLIGQADLMGKLYTEVLVPEAVATELNQLATPEPVRRWITHRARMASSCSRARRRHCFGSIGRFGPRRTPRHSAGSFFAKADLVIMDDREGVEEARRLGLTGTGTLGVLDRAAGRGWIDLAPSIARLRQTNFHVDPALLAQPANHALRHSENSVLL
jgi:predicted nucleic acid-binding protein